ncbi:MAG: Crp/Fnr family transcriptional regulator [Clostridia bacterium]|nr:Crp/Fnr family transcriptional regulator [Clostridia bacterium]
MEKYFEIIANSSLFSEINQENLLPMLSCLGARTQTIAKGAPIFNEGEPVSCMGMVLEGSVRIERTDYYGNRSIIASISPGELFAEMFACAGIKTLPVSAVSVTDSTIMLMDVQRILTTCSSACTFHKILIENLLRSVASKNLSLNSKIHCMSQRTTREKILSYLDECAKRASSPEFTIPFDRQGLADYLGVERSAMSAELSRMKKEGLIDTKGSYFRLLH